MKMPIILFFFSLFFSIKTNSKEIIFPFFKYKVKKEEKISTIINKYQITGERFDIFETINPGLFTTQGKKKVAHLKKFKIVYMNIFLRCKI